MILQLQWEKLQRANLIMTSYHWEWEEFLANVLFTVAWCTLVMFAGDIPPFIVHGSDDITTTVTEVTKGQSNKDFISLSGRFS